MLDRLNNFINNLIPKRFKVTYEQKTKARGFVITQSIIGVLLILIGLFLGIVEGDLVEFFSNTFIGIYIVAIVFSLRLFKDFENYVNASLLGGYVGLFSFITISGGLFAGEMFWLALLISININYTKTKHTLFWIGAIIIFVAGIFWAQNNGFEFPKDQISMIEKSTTLFSFFMLTVAITYSYSIINKKRMSYHMEIIENHKRLIKERDDLMSIIAHDMKSPSSRIEGLISIFDLQNLTADQKEILHRLKSTANESKQLIDDLLEAKSFQDNLSIEKVNINDLISDLTIGFLPLANKKRIRIFTMGLKSNLWIETSAYQLRRILDNILSNAIKFSPFDTRIEIVCVQNKTNLSIAIQDQGPGFSKDDEAKMFQMFQKLSARPTAGEGSTGLGLSIIKNLTSLLNGEVKYVTQLSKGTTFTLILPNKQNTKIKGS